MFSTRALIVILLSIWAKFVYGENNNNITIIGYEGTKLNGVTDNESFSVNSVCKYTCVVSIIDSSGAYNVIQVYAQFYNASYPTEYIQYILTGS